MCSFRRKWDAIAYDVLVDTCRIAVVPLTITMEPRLSAGRRKALPLVHECADFLARWGRIDLAEAFAEPELAAAEVLHRFMAGEAAQLDSRIEQWLHVAKPPTEADGALVFALEQIVYRMIAAETIERLDPPDAA